MTGQQLRNSILQEAIQGRLIPNVLEPGEKTGAELLQEILAERQKKENDEKGKKAKRLTLSTIEENPWVLPEGWCWCTLGDIFDIYTGDSISESLKESKYKRVKIGYNYIGTKDVEFDHSVVYENGVKIPFNEPKFKIAKSTAVLMCIEGGSAGKKIARITQDVCFGNKLCNFYCKEKITNDYLYYYLQSANFRELFFDKINGLIGGVSIKKLLYLEIPLPPLSIQKAIVAKIEELLPLVDEYGKAAEELEALNKILPDKIRKSVLQEAIHGNLVPNDIPEGEATGAELLLQILKERQEKENKEKGKKAKKLTLSTIEEEPWDLPEGWCWCKVGDIGLWGAGATPQRGKTDYYQGGTIPWLKTGELNNSVVYDTEEKVTPLALEQCSLRLCQPNDVLIAMYGATIGKLAIAGVPLTTNQACCACTPYAGIFNKYLFFFLLAKKDDFTKQAFGGAQPNISKEKIVDTVFPLPPLSIQHRIVEKIEEVFSAINKLQA